MRRVRPSVFVRFVVILILLAGFGTVVAAQSSPATHKEAASPPAFTVAFQGATAFGPCNPAVVLPSDYAGFTPIDSSWGAGITIEYAVIPEIRLFLDGNYFSYRKQVGAAGQYSSSEWVQEMTDYSTSQLHFSENAYFDMDSTGFRAGLKLGFPTGNFEPWAGAGYGYYHWNASYDTSDRTASWGSASGYVWGLTYLAGVDWWMSLSSKNALFVRLYADLTAPAVFPVINNLFEPGWTWDNSGGNNIMGAYRFGIAIGVPM